MNTANSLRGTGVALVTPFFENGSIDFESLAKLIEHQINGKVDYLVVLGTTGETASISDEERFQILDFVIDQSKGRVPLVAGFGGNDTQHVVESLAKYNRLNEYQAILSVCPYYNRPNQEGLYLHYKAIAEASTLPIILYNVPSRTGCNMEAATTLRLAKEFNNIIAIKEASANMPQIMEICRDREDEFLVISGDDIMTLPMMPLGIDGLISVLGNALPNEVSNMIRAALNKDYEKAQSLHFRMLRMMHFIFEEGNPVGVKALMNSLGICATHVRLPLAPASKGLTEKIRLEADTVLNKPVLS